MVCSNENCNNPAIGEEIDAKCWSCLNPEKAFKKSSTKYPAYFKSTGGLSEIDVYAVHHLFNIQDPSGAIQHASKKLLLAGVRTGSKSKHKDIKEAKDTLNRWLELNPES